MMMLQVKNSWTGELQGSVEWKNNNWYYNNPLNNTVNRIPTLMKSDMMLVKGWLRKYNLELVLVD